MPYVNCATSELLFYAPVWLQFDHAQLGVIVLAIRCGAGVIEPVLFERTLDGKNYLDMLRKRAVPRMQVMPNFGQMLFQQDGAHLIMRFLRVNYCMQRSLRRGLSDVEVLSGLLGYGI